MEFLLFFFTPPSSSSIALIPINFLHNQTKSYQLCVHLEAICRHSFFLQEHHHHHHQPIKYLYENESKEKKTKMMMKKEKKILWIFYDFYHGAIKSTRLIIFNGYHFMIDLACRSSNVVYFKSHQHSGCSGLKKKKKEERKEKKKMWIK